MMSIARAPTVRTQLAILAVFLVGLIVLVFVGEDGTDPAEPGAALSPTTTVPLTTTSFRGFPPATDQSVCRTLLTTEEAEVLVGRDLAHEVIEPSPAQCAWPIEEGTPLDAELFLVVKERETIPLRQALRLAWSKEQFRLEPARGLGEEAFYVIRRAESGAGAGTDPFVEGVDVFVGDFHVLLGNGGEDVIWEGTIDEVKARLHLAMTAVLARMDDVLR